MYSVIQPTEVLDENDEMISTWSVLATDLDSVGAGNEYITANVEDDIVEFTWVIKTSDILSFKPEELMHIVVVHDDQEEDPDALLNIGAQFPPKPK